MPLTNFPNGLSSFGVPVMGGAGNILPVTTGKYVFVSSATGSNSNTGEDTDKPKATLNGAVAACRASKGDVIVLMPGHTESVTSATTQVLSKAGITVVGLGWGRLRPTFNFTNTAGSFEMDAANCVIRNVVFTADVSAVVVGINVDAANCVIEGCEFDYVDTGDDFAIYVDASSVVGTQFLGNVVRGESGTAGSTDGIVLVASHKTVIDGNVFIGQWSNAPISNATTLSTRVQVTNNYIYNADTSDGNGIAFTVANTGLIANNRIATLYATSVATVLDPGSCLCAENYVVNAIDETGIVVPTTAST